MKISIHGKDNISIEMLSDRQFALLIEAALGYWWETGDYQINVNERERMTEVFKAVNANSILDLDTERKDLEERFQNLLRDIRKEREGKELSNDQDLEQEL